MASRLHDFKTQFAEEYLQQLRRRHQIDHHEDPIEVPKIAIGDLVVVKNDIKKRHLWDLALVLEILPSGDGRERAALLRTKNGEITRPVVKLYPLRTRAELQGTPEQDQPNGHVATVESEQMNNYEQVADNEQMTNTNQMPETVLMYDIGQTRPNHAPVDSTMPGTQPGTSPARPQRRAKMAGRARVRAWAQDLQSDE